MTGITRAEFLEYEELRQSAITNMLGANSVLGWEPDRVALLRNQYAELAALWPKVKDEAVEGAQRWRDLAEYGA